MALPKLWDYPPDVFAPVNVALAKIRGEDVPLKELAHAGWHFAGFAQGQWDVHPPAFMADDGGKSLSEAELVTWLERIEKGPQSFAVGESIPWDLIIAAVLKLIDLWLKS